MKARPSSWTTLSALVVAGFFAVSLWCIGDYGIFVDETNSWDRGRESVEVAGAVLSGAAPAPELVADLAALRHPPLFAMLNWATGEGLQKLGLGMIEAHHVLVIVMATLGLALVWLLARRYWDERTAFLAVLVMALFPRFVGQAQFNPKEIPTLAAMTFAILCILRAAERRTLRSGAACGAAMGVAIACGLFALILPLVLGLALALREPDGNVAPRRAVAVLGTALAVMVAVAFVAWPLLWLDPAYAFRTTRGFAGSFWPYHEMFFGIELPGNHMPWSYTLTYLVLCTPTLVTVAIVVGAAVVGRQSQAPRTRRAMWVCAAWFALPVLVTSLPGVTRYDTIRHVMIALPPMFIAAAIGIGAGLDALARRLPRAIAARAARAALALLTLELGAEVVRWHPDEDSYYSEVVRTIVPSHIELRFRFGESKSAFRRALAWVNLHAPFGSHVVLDFEWLGHFYGLRPDLVFDARDPDFMICAAYSEGNRCSTSTGISASSGHVVHSETVAGSVLVGVIQRERTHP